MRICHHTPQHASSQSTQCIGAYGEDLVAHALVQAGCSIVARNWRTRYGELDLVVRDGETVIAVEVKTRSGPKFGTPFEAITDKKVRRLRMLLGIWLHEHSSQCQQIRIDAIAVTLSQNAPPHIERMRGIG
ncbi:MAG: YraN family protein [Canibacter sp.]